MNKKLLLFVFVYSIILVIVAGFVISRISGDMKEFTGDGSMAGTISVEMNEVENLILSGDLDAAKQKCDEVSGLAREAGGASYKGIQMIWIFVGVNVVGIIIMACYVNYRVLKPFDDMKSFANEISKGNLDASLKMDRGNFFGDFTWAFENMRKEISKSRNAEKTAIENNKTVIATLSHDIKTPVASIRAYAEAFEANMDSTPEKRQKFLSILMEKCDEVSRLTNDLFIHSISEMNRLEVKDETFDVIDFMRKDVRKLFVEDEEVDIILPDRDSLGEDSRVMIHADSKRLLQVMENLKNNADKYAKTRVEIKLELLPEEENSSADQHIRIHFRDFGSGIPEEEIPFITGKFYRGKNVGGEPGSGLGLYIVNELVQKMGGKFRLINMKPGLDATVEL
ncbi:MAG: HAMP domain-containing histidine kinase [Eubacterium sp.]|nr:HAMP domain-containing histidine kinase [Eubacterium sp.]